MFPQHGKALEWLDNLLNGTAPVGVPWPSILAFVRLVTNPRIFEQPETIGKAWQQIEEWLDCQPVWIPRPTERHREILGSILTEQDIRANLVPDTHLAALAIEHGLILCSTDGDFGRFTDLRWENPIRN
ncbi:MAG: type II toxin-antitoxin system VapC family toxin [Planctomycetes bacterium]|nr:type II toxin-antitoxin system VapC family toxin [Planctomycetota bacterium]